MEACSHESLQQFLSENATDLASFSLEEFREWLEARIEKASRHDLFQERCLARDLKREYGSELRLRERRLQRAEQEYQADFASQAIEQRREKIRDLTNAVEELCRAVAENRAGLAKLTEFESRQKIAVVEYQHLRNTTPTWQANQ
jgi:hypothetical protein